MDSRNLIFPMTAGDLVQSAVIVGQEVRGGPLLKHYEVLSVEYANDNRLEITVMDTVLKDVSTFRLNKETPILVTSISRS